MIWIKGSYIFHRNTNWIHYLTKTLFQSTRYNAEYFLKSQIMMNIISEYENFTYWGKSSENEFFWVQFNYWFGNARICSWLLFTLSFYDRLKIKDSYNPGKSKQQRSDTINQTNLQTQSRSKVILENVLTNDDQFLTFLTVFTKLTIEEHIGGSQQWNLS